MDNFAPPQNNSQAPLAPPGISPAPDIEVPSAPSGSSKTKLIIIIALVVVVLIVVALGAFLFVKSRAKNESTNKESQAQVSTVSRPTSDKSQDSLNLGDKKVELPTAESSVPSPIASPVVNLYTNTALGFSIIGPENWEKVELGKGILVAYRDPQKIMTANNLETHSSINVIVETVGTSVSLDQYAKSANAARALLFQNYVLLGSSKDNLGGQPAYIDDYKITIGSFDMRQRQVYTIKNGNTFIITFGTIPQSWDSNLALFDQVRSSFTFVGTVSGAKTKSGIILGVEAAF